MRTRISGYVVGGLIALASLPGSALAADLQVDFSWAGVNACTTRTPAFKIGGIPDGTKKLSFKMVDLNKPGYPHGGGTVDYAGSGDIPAGAFHYVGPCPPFGKHTYEFTVQALAAGGKVLASGKSSKPFPP